MEKVGKEGVITISVSNLSNLLSCCVKSNKNQIWNVNRWWRTELLGLHQQLLGWGLHTAPGLLTNLVVDFLFDFFLVGEGVRPLYRYLGWCWVCVIVDFHWLHAWALCFFDKNCCSHVLLEAYIALLFKIRAPFQLICYWIIGICTSKHNSLNR